ncbi:hypothetical protein LguiB_010752 [Lonicera macranthoides]
MLEVGELSASDSEFFITNFNQSNHSELNKKSVTSTKKRFSDDQIRSLELMFESESKLEPKKKLQLARELGLQPRQVAIWFQNKRARYKSKQLERDYNILMANYNTLNSQFEALKKEKQSLILQLKKLHDLMDKSGDEGQQVQATARNSGGSSGSGSSSSDVKSENIGEREDGKRVISSYSDEDDSSIIKAEYLGVDEEAAIAALNGVSFESNENWAILESDGLLDHCTTTTTSSTSSSYQWWDFWS